jgi:hypothetical protein
MKLLPISGQKGQTLLEFYSPNEWPSEWNKMPDMMCQLIKLLDLIEHEPVWVFTSHTELLFTDENDHQTWQVLVKVIELDQKQYYKITAAQKSPWHHLTGFTDDPKLAADLVIEGLLVSVKENERNVFMDSN